MLYVVPATTATPVSATLQLYDEHEFNCRFGEPGTAEIPTQVLAGEHIWPAYLFRLNEKSAFATDGSCIIAPTFQFADRAGLIWGPPLRYAPLAGAVINCAPHGELGTTCTVSAPLATPATLQFIPLKSSPEE